jgi:hypothetical protein
VTADTAITLSETMVDRAAEAFEGELHKWAMERIRVDYVREPHASGWECWVVGKVPDFSKDGQTIADDPDMQNMHKFEGLKAKRDARHFIRLKCLRAALTAALETTS